MAKGEVYLPGAANRRRVRQRTDPSTNRSCDLMAETNRPRPLTGPGGYAGPLGSLLITDEGIKIERIMIKEAKIASIMPLFPLPQYVVVLEDVEKTRLVPIWIGVNEGNAIALALQGEKFPRPLTHDLIVNLLKTMNATVEKIVISDLKDNSYYAIIHLKIDGKILEIDARPSDSLAIAVRTHSPIYIDETVLAKCPPISTGPISKDEIDKFKDELKTMAPEEFFKRLEEAPPVEQNPGGIGIQFGDVGYDPEDEEEDDGEDDEEGDE